MAIPTLTFDMRSAQSQLPVALPNGTLAGLLCELDSMSLAGRLVHQRTKVNTVAIDGTVPISAATYVARVGFH